MAERIHLKNVRLSFPYLHAKRVNEDGSVGKYGANLILSTDDPQVDAINDLIDKVAQANEKWAVGNKWKAILGQLRAADKVCLHNGDMKAQYDGYEGNWFVSSNSETKPLVLDRDRTVLGPDVGRPFSGCYVDASIEIWAQDNKFGKRINATLRWVQYRKDGDAFAATPPANVDEVPEITDDEDEAPLV